jgi:hypothetical protein
MAAIRRETTLYETRSEVQRMDRSHSAVAQEFVEILTQRAQRSGISPARKLREHHRHFDQMATLLPDLHLQAVLAELDHQSAILELDLGSELQHPKSA